MGWVKTDKHVVGAIIREHIDDLQPYGCCTCPDGDPSLGHENPYIYTEWGFNNGNKPLLRIIQTKENREQKDYDYRYDLFINNCDCDY